MHQGEQFSDRVVRANSGDTYIPQVRDLASLYRQDRFLLNEMLFHVKGLPQSSIGKSSRSIPRQRHTRLGSRTGSDCHDRKSAGPIENLCVEFNPALPIDWNVRKNTSSLR